VKAVSIQQAKEDFSRLVDEAAERTEIIIMKRGKPRARLIACDQARLPAPRKPRVWGRYKGKIWISDDFDAPLPDEELRLWGMK
jgi:prevent-host-death family protein